MESEVNRSTTAKRSTVDRATYTLSEFAGLLGRSLHSDTRSSTTRRTAGEAAPGGPDVSIPQGRCRPLTRDP